MRGQAVERQATGVGKGDSQARGGGAMNVSVILGMAILLAIVALGAVSLVVELLR